MNNPVEVKGVWYPAGSARRVAATLQGGEDRFQVTTEDGKTVSGSPGELEISKRVGNINRSVVLPDQSVFETSDNEGVDSWLRQTSGMASGGLLHHLETRWVWIGVALLAVVLFIYFGGRYGVPWVSGKVAQHMPQNVVHYVSKGSLDLLDQWFLDPSELDADRRETIRARFKQQFGDGYQLYFRHMGTPNALALPDGSIVVTDRFIDLATTAEFDAVVLHETGHIQLRHGMQQLVQSSIVAFVVAMVLGDPSGLEEVVIALPVFLVQSHYSRKHEAAADEFAFREMMARGIDPIHFARIMKKLQKAASAGAEEVDDGANASQRSVGEYLSSHPSTRQRIEKAEGLSREFNQRGQD